LEEVEDVHCFYLKMDLKLVYLVVSRNLTMSDFTEFIGLVVVMFLLFMVGGLCLVIQNPMVFITNYERDEIMNAKYCCG